MQREGGHILLFGNSAAVAWVWGLGFFFSIHFSFLYGLQGLLAFVIPNTLGLIFFGILVNRLSKTRNLETWFFSSVRKAPVIVFAYQITALAITVFAFAQYLWAPAIGFQVLLVAAGFLAFGSFMGELLRLRGIVVFHTVISFFCLAVAAVFLIGSPWPGAVASSAPRAPFDATFAGFIIPLIAGLLVGPWFDIQQWQRAIALHQRNSSVLFGFLWAAAIFFAYIMVIGTLTLSLTGGLEASRFVGANGLVHAQSALTTALQSEPVLLTAFGLAAGLVLIGTIDSAKVALNWYLTKERGAVESPLVAMIPEKVFTSATPYIVAAFLIVIGLVWVGGSIEYLMILYASLFLGYSAQFAWAAFRVKPVAHFNPATTSAGAVGLVLMAIGYFENLPAFMIVAPLVPLVSLIAPSPKTEEALIELEPVENKQVPFKGTAGIAAQAPVQPDVTKPGMLGSITPVEPAVIHTSCSGVEGKTFFHRITATYGDTNSVGNIYFANYFMWVGKTRELFFRHCMPDFDLKKTDFYILTRSFTHKFLQEAREFDEITVKMHISSFNRKFVTMAHTIETADGSLLGKGEQSLMFVQSDNYRLTDIPKSVYNAFITYA